MPRTLPCKSVNDTKMRHRLLVYWYIGVLGGRYAAISKVCNDKKNYPLPTTHYPLKTQHSTRNTQHSLRGFTLVELLIVLFLMGLIYAVAFNTVLSKKAEGEAIESATTLATIDRFFKAQPAYGKKRLDLYCSDKMVCYLSVEGNVTATLDLAAAAMGYRLNPDETLQILDYPRIRLGKLDFRPLYILGCRADGLFIPAIVRSIDTWYYLHPFKGMESFDDPAAMIAAIHQSAYLPDRAGYAQ